MQFSDDLEQTTAMHRNCRHLGRPVNDGTVSLNDLTPLTWMGGNGQAHVSLRHLQVADDADVYSHNQNQQDPQWATFHLWNDQVT